MKRIAGRLWPGLGIFAVWVILTWIPIGAAPLYDDEGYLWHHACLWRHGSVGWRNLLMVSPYTGSLEAGLFWLLQALRVPGIMAVRAVSLSMAAALTVAVYWLVDDIAGSWAAVASAALFLTQPGFFVLAKQDFTGGPLALILAVAGAILLLRWRRSGRARDRLAGCCLLGASVWAHILMIVPVAGGAFAAISTNRRRAVERLGSWKEAGSSALCFLAGLAPLAAFVAGEKRHPLIRILRSDWPPGSRFWGAQGLLRATLSGAGPREFLSASAQQPGYPLAALAALAVSCGLWGARDAGRRRAAACAIHALFCAGAVLLLPDYLNFWDVAIILGPWLAVAVAVAWAEGLRGCGPDNGWRKAALSAPSAALLAASMAVVAGMRATVLAGGCPREAVRQDSGLARFLAASQEPVMGLDRGLYYVPMMMSFGGPFMDSDEFVSRLLHPGRQLDEFLRPGVVVLLHPPSDTSDGDVRSRFFEAVATARLELRLLGAFDSGGRTVLAYRLDQKSAMIGALP